MGKVKNNFDFCGFSAGSDVYDKDGQHIYYHGTNFPCQTFCITCVCGQDCERCKPKCFTCKFTCLECIDTIFQIPIYNPDRSQILSQSGVVVPGIAKYIPCIRAHSAIKFPAQATPEHKELLVSSMLYNRLNVRFPMMKLLPSLDKASE